MSKPSPAKNPSTPAAPSAADAASAAGTQSSQVGAGTQPGAGDSSAPGPASKAKRKPKLHAQAADADIPAAVLTAACTDPDFTDVLGARRYPDRWVLVLMSAKEVRKVEVAL